MRFVCYPQEDGREIRIELTGTQVSVANWKLIRDVAKDKFEAAGWVREVRFPNDRRIIVALREQPTKDEWDDISQQWLNVLEARDIRPERFADNAVSFASDEFVSGVDDDEDDDDEDDDDEDGGAGDRVVLPTIVVSKLQKAFWEECACVMKGADNVAELKEEYEREKVIQRKARVSLRELAEYLDDHDIDIDGSTKSDLWVEAAIEKGALEK